jgi:hypothetical protein
VTLVNTQCRLAARRVGGCGMLLPSHLLLCPQVLLRSFTSVRVMKPSVSAVNVIPVAGSIPGSSTKKTLVMTEKRNQAARWQGGVSGARSNSAPVHRPALADPNLLW